MKKTGPRMNELTNTHGTNEQNEAVERKKRRGADEKI